MALFNTTGHDTTELASQPRRTSDIQNRVFFEVDPYDLISILLETLSYGTFVVLFLLSTILLLRRRRVILKEKTRETARLRSLMVYLITGIMMFCTITAKWTFWWAEVLPIPGREVTSVTHLPRLSRTAYRFKESLIQLTVLLGDGITIYRLWVLSNRSKKMIAFPTAAVFGFLGCAIALSGTANDTTTTPIPIKNGRLKLAHWDIAAICCTVSNTVYVTLMIAWIIIKARMRVGPNLISRGLRQTLAVVTESAAIYTTWNLLLFISGLGLQSEITLSILDCVPAIYGISVMLIHVRVGLGWARNDDRDNGPSTNQGGTRGICMSTVVYTTTGYGESRRDLQEGYERSSSSSVTVATGSSCVV